MAWNSQEGQSQQQRLLRAFLPAPTSAPRLGTGAWWQKWLWAETWQKGLHWILPLWRKCSTAWPLRMELGIPFPIMQLGRERLGHRENGQGASLSRGLVMLPDTSNCRDLPPQSQPGGLDTSGTMPSGAWEQSSEATWESRSQPRFLNCVPENCWDSVGEGQGKACPSTLGTLRCFSQSSAVFCCSILFKLLSLYCL